MEQKNESSLATPWLERWKKTGTSTSDNIDYWAMLQEISQGQQ